MAQSLQRQVARFERVLLQQGGAIREEPCRSEELPALAAGSRIKGAPTAAKVDVETAYTCGCGNQTIAVIPYEPESEDSPNAMAVICAICDAGTRMPRFQEEVAA